MLNAANITRSGYYNKVVNSIYPPPHITLIYIYRFPLTAPFGVVKCGVPLYIQPPTAEGGLTSNSTKVRSNLQQRSDLTAEGGPTSNSKAV